MVPGSWEKDRARSFLHAHIHELTQGKKGAMLFLAGLRGLDIPEARKHGVSDKDLIGIESKLSVRREVRSQYPNIEIRPEDIGYVAWMITNVRKKNIRAAICDYCGTWKTSEKPSKKVLACLSKGAYLSITLERARDGRIENEKHLFETVFASLTSVKEVTHVSTTLYQSRRKKEDSNKESNGSPMMTMGFLVGRHDITPNIIDMRGKKVAAKKQSKKKAEKTLAQKRHEAAIKAWETRRKNAKKK